MHFVLNLIKILIQFSKLYHKDNETTKFVILQTSNIFFLKNTEASLSLNKT